jgi:H+-transporting ATPase
LVFTGQATVYLVRERRHFWNSVPGFWLMVASSAAVVVTSTFAALGILMASISLLLILGVLALVIICSVLLDFLKIRVFRYCDLR